MKTALIIGGVVVAIFLGIAIGYAIGVDSVHREAVAYNTGTYVANGNGCGNTFVWTYRTK